jgi:hypothetical protein
MDQHVSRARQNALSLEEAKDMQAALSQHAGLVHSIIERTMHCADLPTLQALYVRMLAHARMSTHCLHGEPGCC